MAQRGRKSAASLAVVASVTEHRPEPPDGLTEAQADEWRGIVARMPNGFFTREMYGLLTSYCQHVTAARMLASLIDSFKPEWVSDPEGLDRLGKLLAMRERETKAMASIATKLRMTPQSRYMPNAAARAAADARPGRAPWEPVA